MNAPEFPAGLDWLNVREPISLAQLRGKIVLLDFWTYCCINCIHIIPDLKRLERKYPNELVVIGVHSAKFQSEKDTRNILSAVLRHEIEHPVVNDHSMQMWQQYTVRSWPTVVLIDPAGKVVFESAGENVFAVVDPVIAQMAADFDARGLLKKAPFHSQPLVDYIPRSLLSFPGKVFADLAGGRLFIADTCHNRIVIAGLDGDVLDVIGQGDAGADEGDFESAAFNRPQGMCVADGFLYVADTGNHAIRKVDLAARLVSTIGDRRLNSPWDLVAVGGAIYIAMAGSHQIWGLDLKRELIGPFAGSGGENIVDGPVKDALLAQPSGITSDGSLLYFADSETSSIRAATLGPDAIVSTIVGCGLFEFGDQDGTGDVVRMQHPLGITFYEGALYVADTYNGKIKRVVPATREVRTLAYGFDEPGGVSAANGKLYVADTNNHAIRIVDLQTLTVATLMLRGLQKLRPRTSSGGWTGETLERSPVSVRAGRIQIVLDPKLPEGLKLNIAGPNRLLIRSDSPALLFEGGVAARLIDRPESFPIEVPADVTDDAKLTVFGEIYYCHEGDEGLCFYKEILISVPVVVSTSSTAVTIDLGFRFEETVLPGREFR